MKITKEDLQQIIKEELENVLSEQEESFDMDVVNAALGFVEHTIKDQTKLAVEKAKKEKLAAGETWDKDKDPVRTRAEVVPKLLAMFRPALRDLKKARQQKSMKNLGEKAEGAKREAINYKSKDVKVFNYLKKLGEGTRVSGTGMN